MLSRQTFTTIACKMVNKRLENQGVVILDTFAEAFRMWCARIIVTACDEHWVKVAAGEVTGYGTSVIGCDAEAGVEQWLSAKQTPDGRPGVAILFFAFNAKALTKAVPNRVGQSLMTCPTTAVFDGLPDAAPRDEADESDKNEEVKKSGDTARIDVGKQIRFFGDGFQKSKVVVDDAGRSRRYWRVPVMDGEFTVEESVGACKAIGGGNIFRGVQVEGEGLDRVQGDYMGMLATIINGMALQSALEKAEVKTRLLTAIKMEQVAEPYIRRRAIRHLQKGRVVIFGGGTGNPYFTTDTAATLRAIEMEVDVIFKGTRVDGIYTADPEKDATATKYDTITFKEVYEKELNIMDMTAFTLCNENKLPIVVFDINQKGNLLKALQGEGIGTLVNF